ncbi:DUF5302 domain-containing protein [Cellulomonas sp. zg-ZUI222]|uniref:DUF5302 domain-containing protein n=1 Tax=Cellulomonas wangleii TaxID=2816956 RepID=A0ABX8D8J0_9CELL|nr:MULTISPECIES: DUF5302 domain-containing protein [Cellulomonas]MBO0900641.1 DUF5302 domain-containing protein [Cellulomonas sp. zg-ZUI22]MBO0921309.1 DUF5302 domain-containing protein [Cellulomonas wangleii]MBO0925725.1 DUF5302 domain-containing protein [Cellulomonas wangleii]QVI63748.1 DUF5302 domain-containing protein [Cellulomonas wangleii]SFK36597.1 hypothetical protein SAMN05216467_3098 [Cellulomonas sp. KH9]
MTQDDQPSAVSDEAKEKFRAALEHKKAQGHRSADGSRNTGAVHGAETAGPVQRRFQRKSGSA